MSNTINVRKAFSYILESSSINYVRNYNFNAATVTDLRLFLANSDATTPLTVDISASVPWIRVTDPSTGKDITFPSGNVVLPPSSSTTMLLKIDLPPEIEAIVETAIYPDLHFRVVSGSNPRETVTTTTATATKNTVVVTSDIVRIFVNEQSEKIIASVYNVNGELESSPIINWRTGDASIAQVDDMLTGTTQVDSINDAEKYIRGVSVGETTVAVRSAGKEPAIIRVIVLEKESTGQTPPPGGTDEGRAGNRPRFE